MKTKWNFRDTIYPLKSSGNTVLEPSIGNTPAINNLENMGCNIDPFTKGKAFGNFQPTIHMYTTILRKAMAMKKIILLLIFLISGIAYSQTTVTLQDQCNCEVLSGTLVTAPGATTPTGADTGDIYVNTSTGTIYFWDGNSWELTSSDDQQLQAFSFNAGTNVLSLRIENGNTVTVNLAALANTGTDDQRLTLAGNILTLEDGGTVNLSPYLDNTDNQQITAFSLNGTTNILTLTLQNGGTQNVDLSGLVGTDDQTAAEVTYNNGVSGLAATDVQAAIDEINAAAGTVALVDNGDGTYDFTDAGGNVTVISDTSVSTMVDNADGTYTYTDETGATGTIDTRAASNPYDNTASGLAATDVQAAIDEINAAAGTVALVDNGDGTYDFTDAGGNVTVISDTSVSTMVDNADGTYTYTDETGATGTIDTRAASNPYDNTASGLAATDVQAAIDEINAAAGTVALVDNGDGTYDFTDAGGNVTVISDTSVSTMVDNADGTYTYTDETGATGTIDTRAASNPYDNTASGLAATDVQAAIDEINAAAGTVALVDNGDGTYDFTDAGGNVTVISDTSVSTMVDNADGTYTYTDETGATGTIDTRAASNPYDNTASGLAATDVQAAIDEINAAAGTVALVDNGDGTYDFTDAGGNVTVISDTSVSTMVDNADGTYTYTDETGATGTIDTRAASNPYDNTASGLAATDVQAAIDEINAAAGTVALVDNGDGTYDFTDAGGNVTVISDTSVSTMVDNADGTYTYTDETGATGTIDTRAASNPYDNTASGLAATDVQAAIDEINAAAGTVALVDNGDGTYDFTDAGGNVTVISDTSVSTMVDNADGTYTYTDETGATGTIDTRAASNPYDNTASGLAATDVQAAIDEINAAAGTVALVDNGDGTYDFTDAGGNVTVISDTSVSTMVDNADGTYTYTDETGATGTIDTRAASNPYDNTASGLAATDVQAAIDEINAAAGTVALVDNGDGTYDFTDAGGNVTVISDTSVSTMVDNADGTYTYTDETGATGTIDTRAASNPYDNTASGLAATDVQAAIDEINAAAGTVALVDNGDGTYDFTDAGGNVTVISDTSVSTMVDNADGTYTYTDETGATGTIDTRAASNPYDNTASGLAATDVQAAIDEINAAAGTVALVDNGDGTYDFTDAGGNVTVISDTSVSTMVDNADGTYTYTDESGATQIIDTNASSNPYDNTVSGLTATDVQAAIDEINGLAGTVALVDNGDGTYDFTDAAGNTTVITDTSISTLVDNADGTYTYTDESGATQIIDTNASSNPYDNTASGLAATDVQAALDELAAGSTDDQNISGSGLAGTNLTIGIENGTNEIVDLSSLVESVIAGAGSISVTDDGNGNYTVNSTDPDEDLTNELTLLGSGAPVVVPSNAGVTYVDTVAGQLYVWDGAVWNVVGGNASPDLDGDPTNELNTTFAVNAGNLEITDNGGTLAVPLTSLGTDDQTAAEVTYDNTASGLTAIDVQAAIDELDAAAGNVALVDNLDGTYTFTDAAGNPTTISDTSISTMVDNLDGTYTYTDEAGVTQTIDTNASSNPYDNTASGLVATDVQAAIDELDAAAGNVALVDNLDGTYTFTDAAGNPTTISDTSISTMVDNLDGTYTYTDEAGVTQTIDTNASSNPYDNTVSGLTAIDVQDALDELAAGSTDDQNISGSGLAGTNLTIGIENGTNEIVDLSSLVETVIAGTGAITVTDDGNGNYTVNSADPDEDLTNELTLIGAGAPAVVPSNAGVTYVDSVAGQLYIWDGAAWNAVGGNASPDLDGDPTNEYNTVFAINGGNLEITDSGGTLSVPLASLGTDDQNIDVLTLNATTNILTVGIEDGNDLTVDLSGLVADGSETIVTGAGINVVTGTGTTADPYVITATEVDGSITNEVNTAFAINGGNLEITDGNGTLSVPLASLGTDDQNIDVLTLNATTNILTVGIEDGNDLTVDLSGLVADGSETIVTGAGINVVTGTGTTADPYVITATEVDGSITNEVNTAFAVNLGNLEITDGNGTLSVPLASLGTDDQNIDVLTLNATTNILTVGIEDGNDLTVDLSGLVADGSETIVTGAGINVVTGTGTTADPYVITATEVDGDITNELTLIGAGGPAGVPSNSGVTYVDNVAGQLYIWDGAAWNAVGGSASPDLDGDPTNEQNTAFAINAGNLEITDSGGTLSVPLASLGTDDQNIDVLTLNATTNILTVGIEDGNDLTVDLSGLVADGSETIVTGAGINVVTGTGTTADPYVITATEVDGSITNEVNTAFAVNLGNLEITDGNGTLSVPLASLGTDDQNIDVLTLNATTNILTVGIEDGNDLTVDLSGLVADGSETIVTGAGINVVTGTGTTADPYVITATEVDGSITNEVNTAFAINGGNLEITDSGGTLSVPLASLGTDDQNIDVLTLNATTNILTVGIEDGNDLTVDLSGLVADGSETIVTGAGINVVTGTGTTADPYVITATEVDGSITNEVNTAFAINGGNLEITDGNGTLSVPLASLGTDDQNIDVLTLNATTNILTVGIEDGNDLTVDLSGLVADGSETIVTGAGINVVTGTGTTADPYVITATEVDGSITNEVNTAFAVNLGNLEITDGNGTLSVPLASLGTDDQNIDVLTLNATTNILTVGIEDGNDLTVDLSGLVADGSETIVTGAGINVVTGTGTTADPYVITATEVDGSITNEVNTAFAINGGNLEITDGNGTLSVPLASLGTDDQNIDVLTLNATTNILTVGIEDGNDLTVDLSGLVADGSETIVTGAGINVVTGTGTTADPYVITATEVDGSITNEVNTAFAVNLGNLEITDSERNLIRPSGLFRNG